MSCETVCLLSSAVVLSSVFHVLPRNRVFKCNIKLCDYICICFFSFFCQFKAGQVFAMLILLLHTYVCSELFELKVDGFVYIHIIF